MFPDAPYIARPGQINAWDNEDFLDAIKKTGKQQLIIAGVVVTDYNSYLLYGKSAPSNEMLPKYILKAL